MQYVENLHNKVPEFNFANTHSRIKHDKNFCLPGDMFEHESAKKYSELILDHE
jgi:hypothetical protein